MESIKPVFMQETVVMEEKRNVKFSTCQEEAGSASVALCREEKVLKGSLHLRVVQDQQVIGGVATRRTNQAAGKKIISLKSDKQLLL